MLHIEINEKPFQFSVPVALPNRNHKYPFGNAENMYEVSIAETRWVGGGGEGEHEAALLLMINLYMNQTESSKKLTMQLSFLEK